MELKSIKNLKNPFEGFGKWKEAIIENKGKEKVANYDRGWDIEPTDEDTKAVLELLLDNEG